MAISGITALWFWRLGRLTAGAVIFRVLLNPVVAAFLGWIVLRRQLSVGSWSAR